MFAHRLRTGQLADVGACTPLVGGLVQDLGVISESAGPGLGLPLAGPGCARASSVRHLNSRTSWLNLKTKTRRRPGKSIGQPWSLHHIPILRIMSLYPATSSVEVCITLNDLILTS